jgi:hypothetical protein
MRMRAGGGAGGGIVVGRVGDDAAADDGGHAAADAGARTTGMERWPCAAATTAMTTMVTMPTTTMIRATVVNAGRLLLIFPETTPASTALPTLQGKLVEGEPGSYPTR